MTVRRLLAVLLTAGAFLALPAVDASAHAALESSSPAANSVVETPPSEILLDFDEGVTPSLASIQLYDADGDAVELGAPQAGSDDTQVVASVPAIDDGLYAVVWRVTSVDGHPVDGAFSFTVGSAPAGDGEALIDSIGGTGGNSQLKWLYGIARYLSFAGLVLLYGVGLWALRRPLLLIRRGRIQVLMCTAGGALLGGSAAAFAFFAAEVHDGRSSSALSASAWADAIDADTGKALLARTVLALVAMVLVLVALAGSGERWAARWWRVSALVVAVLSVLTYSASGHPNAQDARVLWIGVDFLHLAAAVVWIGGLVALAITPSAVLGSDDAAPVVSRFSTAAAVSVAVIVVTGVAQTLQLAGGLDDVSATTWGRLLLTKVTLVAVLLAVAGVSRWLLQHDGAGSIRRTLVIEAVIGMVVIGLAAGMVAQPPRPAVPSAPFDQTITANGVIASVTITPGRVGQNEVHIFVTPRGGSLQPVSNVTARVALPEGDVPNSPVTLQEEGPNHYSGTVTLPRAGDWSLEVLVNVTESDTVLLKATVPIP